MKTKIRQSCFETNSSSTHSLSFKDDETDFVVPYIDPEHGGVYVGNNNAELEFGWQEETYDGIPSKLAYVLLYIRDWAEDVNKEVFRKILDDVVHQQSGANLVVGDWYASDEYGEKGYIDHQSVEDNDLDYLFETPEKLRIFLFGKNSYLETDNDNK
jgi:hypothetical protein